MPCQPRDGESGVVDKLLVNGQALRLRVTRYAGPAVGPYAHACVVGAWHDDVAELAVLDHRVQRTHPGRGR